MDQGRYVACAPHNPSPGCNSVEGQGAIVFTIGLGKAILALDEDAINPLPYGGYMLRWMAAIGDDGNPATDSCATDPIAAGDYTKSCGNYFYAQGGADLGRVFDAIASRIFTRLTQ
jgi:hypothetical protein